MKKTIIALMVCANVANAGEVKPQFAELEKMGLPTPDTGVQVVKSDKMAASSWAKNKDLALTREMQKNGYVHVNSDRAYELLHIDEKIKKDFQSQRMQMPESSGIRQSPEEIAFAYSHVGLPAGAAISYFGIAPIGTYKEGWSGAVEFFQSHFAKCAYSENNFNVSKGSAYIDESIVQHDVNDKITLIDVVGSDNTGYLYKVQWFDSIFNRVLECATNEYSKDFEFKTVELAKMIDKV